jgi:hypothetical protein
LGEKEKFLFIEEEFVIVSEIAAIVLLLKR